MNVSPRTLVTPACGELLRDMLGSTFDADHVTTAVGGLELARTFPTLRWDHLLYTGSPAIGRVSGTVIGALLIGVMNNGLDLLGVESYYQQVIKGGLIVAAVMLDRSRKTED